MARRLTSQKQIDVYVASVITAANHHAPQVKRVIQPLADAVIARLTPSDTIEVYTRLGATARTCWVTFNGNRYCFSYNYDNHVIELRNKSLRGSLRFTFDNSTSAAQIRAQVSVL